MDVSNVGEICLNATNVIHPSKPLNYLFSLYYSAYRKGEGFLATFGLSYHKDKCRVLIVEFYRTSGVHGVVRENRVSHT